MPEPTSFDTYKSYVDTLPLAQALWWFIENIGDDDLSRSDWFFYLRERYRNEAQA